MITQRYNVLHKLNYNINIWLAPIIISIMSLVQAIACVRACASFLVCVDESSYQTQGRIHRGGEGGDRSP